VAREELVVVVLEDGSVKPKPWEPLRRWHLRVEIEIRESTAAQRWLR
jgi:hypothetical protein